MRKLFSIVLILGLMNPAWAVTTTNLMSYGTSNQAITISASHINNAQSVGTAIDNSSNLFLEAMVMCTITSAGASTSATGSENFYVAGTVDGGTTYSDGVSASSATATLTSPPNIRLVGVCNIVANSTVYKCGPYSVSSAFGGIMPDHWSLLIENKTGATTNTMSCWYQGMKTSNQ